MDEEKPWLTEEELKILNMAIELGFFETPRKITLDSLAKKLGLNSRYVSGTLREINKKMLMKYIEKMKTPLKG